MKNRLWKIGLPIIGILILALIGFGISQIPSVEKALPPDAIDLTVSLNKPAYGSTVPLDTSTVVAATAIGGRSISSLELWVDGARLESKAAPAGSSLRQFTTFWAWDPADAGVHTLVVRVIDSDGRIAGSNLVRVTAGDGTGGADLPINEQAPSNPPSSPGGPAGTGGSPPSGFSFWVKKNLLSPFSPVKAPAAPNLSVQTAGCNVNLRITDTAMDRDGFFVYRLDPAGSDFLRVATLGPGSGESIEYTDLGLAGHVEYYVAAFNTAGETPGNLAAANLDDPACLTASWSGLKIRTADLTVKVPVDKLYCYYAFGSSPWARLPASGNDFILPKDGVFDLASAFGMLPANAGAGEIPLAMDCWGWSGGSLMDLGTATKNILPADTKGPIKLTGSGFDLTLDMILAKMGPILMFSKTPLIMPPYNFTRTTSLVQCEARSGVGDYLAKIICESAFSTGATVLTWDWIPTCIFPVEVAKIKCTDYIKDTDGFRIYKTTGTSTVLFRTVKDRNQSMLVLPAGTLDGPPSIYTVRAFKGSRDSDDSNPYVFSGAGTATNTVTLRNPVLVQEDHTDQNHNRDLACKIGDFMGDMWTKIFGGLDASGTGEDTGPGGPATAVAVGFANHYIAGSFPFDCWEYYGIWSRGKVQFDLGGVKSPVWKAQLNFQTRPGSAVAGDAYAGFSSCAATINFLTGADTFETYDALSPTVTAYTVDVTEAVKRWVENGEPNFGFLLRPYKEKFAFNRDVCMSIFEHFELTVTYFVTP